MMKKMQVSLLLSGDEPLVDRGGHQGRLLDVFCDLVFGIGRIVIGRGK